LSLPIRLIVSLSAAIAMLLIDEGATNNRQSRSRKPRSSGTERVQPPVAVQPSGLEARQMTMDFA
jgi:hypothetical protein